MRLVMSPEAEGDGAWVTVLDRLRDFTVTVRTTNSSRKAVTGTVKESDDVCLKLRLEHGGVVAVPWQMIEEIEYV